MVRSLKKKRAKSPRKTERTIPNLRGFMCGRTEVWEGGHGWPLGYLTVRASARLAEKRELSAKRRHPEDPEEVATFKAVGDALAG